MCISDSGVSEPTAVVLAGIWFLNQEVLCRLGLVPCFKVLSFSIIRGFAVNEIKRSLTILYFPMYIYMEVCFEWHKCMQNILFLCIFQLKVYFIKLLTAKMITV